MKKVLIGFIMDGTGGGIDGYLLNFLETVGGEDVQMDFLTNHIDEGLRQRLEKYHSRLFEIPSLHHPFKQYARVCHLIQKNHYDIVYLNISTAIDCVAALAARKCMVKKRVLHCHASGNDCSNALKRLVFNSIHKICRLFLVPDRHRVLRCFQTGRRVGISEKNRGFESVSCSSEWN